MPPELSDPSDPQEWLRRAQGHLALAKQARTLPGVLTEDLCFHAQQCAELAVKAALVKQAVDFPKTHSIRELLRLCAVHGIRVPEEILDATDLTPYAIATRYPGAAEPLAEEELSLALRVAKRVYQWAESLIRS